MWDFKQGGKFHEGLAIATGSAWVERSRLWWIMKRDELWMEGAAWCPQGDPASDYARFDWSEDWAESVTATVYPNHPRYTWDLVYGNGPIRRMDEKRHNYVLEQFKNARKGLG